jgi:hypothetical protein
MNKKLIGSVLISALAIYSCQKNDDALSVSDTGFATGAESEVIGTQVYETSLDDVQSISVEKFDGSTRAYTLDGFNPGHGFGLGFGHIGSIKFGIPHIDSCATITVSSSTFPKTIVIDYGTGCSSKKRHVKTGKIIIEMTDTAINAGAIKTITYENFTVDSMKVELSATLKNLGQNSSGNWVIESQYEQKITKTNGDIIVQKSQESVEWISGFATTEKSDDVYYKSGSGSVTVNDALKFSKTITTPLLIDKSCGFIKSGVVEVSRNGNTSVIDYGDGTCDSSATITANDSTATIDLNESHMGCGKSHKGSHGSGKH